MVTTIVNRMPGPLTFGCAPMVTIRCVTMPSNMVTVATFPATNET